MFFLQLKTIVQNLFVAIMVFDMFSSAQKEQSLIRIGKYAIIREKLKGNAIEYKVLLENLFILNVNR